jgi:hypothetical protein
MSFISTGRQADTSEAELIRICAEHIVNRDAYNASPGLMDFEVDPLWHAYRRTHDAISAAKPQTLAGLVAKARATKGEATNSDGIEEPHDAADWAFDLVNDLIRLDEGGELTASTPFVDPIVTLWAKLQIVNAELERAEADHKELRDLISHRRPGQPKGVSWME